jgi:alkylhydroperoxidase/carboxymuconolactone decarboxylase family protein YurZ
MEDVSLTPHQKHLKSRFNSLLGAQAYDAQWARLLTHSPEMFAASLRLHSIPKQKRALDLKTQSLISLAVSAASTHLHVPHIHRHTRAALLAGASREEIVEVMCLTSTLGIHACNIGVPVLVEVLREAGRDIPEGMNGMSASQWELRDQFTEKRGYWHAFWEEFLRFDKEFFGAYLEFSSVPWRPREEDEDRIEAGEGKGVLEPRVKELVYCAFDAAATHLYRPGLKLHMQNVLGLGGTVEEIMEVLELATLLGTSTLDVGLEVLDKELEGLGEKE